MPLVVHNARRHINLNLKNPSSAASKSRVTYEQTFASPREGEAAFSRAPVTALYSSGFVSAVPIVRLGDCGSGCGLRNSASTTDTR